MLRLLAYVIFFFLYSAVSSAVLSDKDKPEFPVDTDIWSLKSEISTEDGRKVTLYEDSSRYNEFTTHSDGNTLQRIYLKDKPVLVWDKNLTYSPEKASYANIISPPLYSLQNNNGELFMKELTETTGYMEGCDKPVWGMFTNGYNPDNTRAFITDDKKRLEIAEFITDAAVTHGMQGVNIDFENMYAEDAELFTLFIKDLSEKLHENNIILSVDVTKINKGSMFYSMCYNRAELSKYADYVILMAYDQFSRTSEVSGPIASIQWTEEAIQGMLPEVPTERFMLGIPFYTRSWEETDGVVTACPAISMTQSNELIKEHSASVSEDIETGLDYFEYSSDGKIYKVWQENADSVAKRCALAEKYNLAGIACWSLDYESADIDKILSEY